jgi:acetoin utilization protein AcuB
MKQRLIKDWMTTEVITITRDTKLPEAHRLMVSNNIRRLPVVNNRGQLVGIVTRGDVRGAEASEASSLSIWELNYLLARLKVNSIMTTDVITMSPDDTIIQAAQVMMENKVSGLPVVDQDGRVVGIITESDIFRMVVDEWRAN